MHWLEHKYINLLSSRLDKFKRKGPNLYNFRCPKCGDSANKNKARGYIYEKEGKASFHCHNCGASSSASKFIKDMDLNMYNEMIMEKIASEKTPEQLENEEFFKKLKKPVFMTSGPLKGLKKVSQLSPDHPVKKFVDSRKIPTTFHSRLFACPNYMRFVNNIIPKKFEEELLDYDEMRLLIPFFDKQDNLHAFQGRSLKKSSSTKYITIILDESKPKVYGLDRIDYNLPINVFEGPIDSMFVSNSLAVAGGEMVSALREFVKKNLVLIYDNEPRSIHTVNKIEKSIFNGYNVCIWPNNLEHKDVNDMILAGMSPALIEHTIKQHTFSDLRAKIELSRWRKI